MPIMIYNSLTRKKELFEPLDPAGKRVTIYNCGPTVYDRFHIGNARNFVVMDIVRRYFEWSGYSVKFVQNLTDIDDKIIERANKEGRGSDEVAREFIAAYHEDVGKLGVRRADEHPAATEFVEPMIAFMEKLIEKGLSYESGGSVYFRVREFAEYGKLSGRNVDDLREGARVEVNPEKEDSLDFVLWKAAKPGEPSWPSPWGEGRPGWHTECAVMTHELLGETIDIHAGGHDLIFPHHENEIAQREGLSGKPFARYWMHNGFLNIDSEKMSKSAGNFFKIDDVLAHHLPEAVRMFLLSALYRHPLDYNDGALREAGASVGRINDGLATAEKILGLGGRSVGAEDFDRADPIGAPFIERFEAAMDDDFNTQKAAAVLHDIVSAIHEARAKTPPDLNSLASLAAVGFTLRDFFGFAPTASERLAHQGGSAGNVVDINLIDLAISANIAGCQVGLSGYKELLQTPSSESGPPWADLLGRPENLPKLDDPVDVIRNVVKKSADYLPLENYKREQLKKLTAPGNQMSEDEASKFSIAIRELARRDKNFPMADAVREGFALHGVEIEDHPQGTIWKRIEKT